MKRFVALSLIIALSFVVLVPLPASAGAATDAALALGAFAVLNQIVRGQTIFHPQYPQHYPQYPVYGPNPGYPAGYPSYPYPSYPSVVYHQQFVQQCDGQANVRYGWRPHPSGNGLEYVPLKDEYGRTIIECRGQVRVSPW